MILMLCMVRDWFTAESVISELAVGWRASSQEDDYQVRLHKPTF